MVPAEHRSQNVFELRISWTMQKPIFSKLVAVQVPLVPQRGFHGLFFSEHTP